ncbi:MAG: FAD:protein FMN transferase [Rhodospirillaceae bacterium]
MSELLKISRRGFLAMPLVLAGCKFSPTEEVLEISGPTMGTTYRVTAVDKAGTLSESALRGAIETALAEVNAQLSNWHPGSEISRFNAQKGTESVPVSDMLATVMQGAETVNKASLGRFDTTAGPLIDLWGFGSKGTPRKPSEAEITAAQQRTGHGQTLRVGAGSLQKIQPDTEIYLSAIGKGYGADHIAQAIQGLGVRDFMIDIGGDLYTAGRNPDGVPWQIGIERPAALSGGVLEVVGVSGLGMASSGDYRNYFEQDGKRYSHIIDPTTGSPITHKTAGATVLADTAMEADAWATAMLILGREKGLQVAQDHNIAVMFVDRDTESSELRFKSISSPRFEALIS